MINPENAVFCLKRAWLVSLIIMLLGAAFAVSALPLDELHLASEDETLALIGAKIYRSPTEKPIINGIVLIKDGKITAVGERGKINLPRNIKSIDCAGLILTAAFWNSHVHFTESKWQNAAQIPAAQLTQQFQEMLTRYGFAHVFDIGSELQNTLALRQRVTSSEVPGPAIFTTGFPFVPPNGSPFYIAPLKLPEFSSADNAAGQVRRQLLSGADAIKLFAASPASRTAPPVVMPLPFAKAAVAAAHAQGKLVFAHPSDNAGVEVVLNSGVDILAHTAPDGGEPWNDEFVKRMLSAKVALMPTLKLWKWEVERGGGSPEAVEKLMTVALQQLRAYSQAHGEILFGTDVGYMTDYDTRDEYVLMNKAGMDFRQILTALTTAPAAKFGLAKQTGKIAPGFDADLVLLAGDPAADVTFFSQVKYTFRQGKIIYQAAPAAQNPIPASRAAEGK